MATKTKTAPKLPVHEIRIGGIKAAIWKNDTERGPRHSVQLTRSYQVEGEWKTTNSFGSTDLAILAQVAPLAFAWIHNAESEAKTS